MIQRIAIVGVGLIGGSLGLVWNKERPELHIVGHDAPEVLDAALAAGAIDEAEADLEAAVQGADLVMLAVPMHTMAATLEACAPRLRPGCILSDVGSVKAPIAALAARRLPPGAVYIGGHPMAGSEKGGVEHANAFMFENATYALCPPDGMSEADFQQRHADFLEVIGLTGARILLMQPERHDRIAAVVSHLPQLLAVTLVNYTSSLNTADDAFLRLAAGGFRDMTRIASSSFDLWRDILKENEGAILDALAGYAAAFQKLRNRIIEDDYDGVGELFRSARRIRDTIPKNAKGFLSPLLDVFVFVEDKPGALHAITGGIAEAGINIKDIELLKIREGIGGALRLSFGDHPTAEAAVAVLRRIGFTAYIVS